MKKSTSGFTIVELLIVIVVIAILATISIVAYNGIQNRANNTALISDLTALKKKLELYKVDNDSLYPGGSSGGMTAALGYKMTKEAYAAFPVTESNFWYCRVADRTRYGVIALGKSGDIYYITEKDSPTKYTGSEVWKSTTQNCSTMIKTDLGWQYAGYDSSDITNGPYRAWVGGN